jgi:hypothetical protein
MRFMPSFCYRSKLSVVVGAVCLGFTIRAVQAAGAAPAASVSRPPASPNAAPTLPDAPKSVFVIPGTPQEGKDPFFPLSTRLRPMVRPPGTNPAPVVVIAELELKGISGIATHRLAIINNRTFETGEEGDVICNGARVHVKCGEIGPDSVVVIVNGKERIVQLHTKF